ncbi:F0F1 ATP synthase subunit delta [Campylobacter sp. US33a]|uniref:F0F1 ATP synthase subunit delta n=1 Tax=Campylobacter sp. US33a TaxID=2498120 RepID=UPI0010673EB1|nr:F0F1 ATP synthase subunit delta [Campylobacter sp. US33a]TEY03120.1 F0F1 ATP synthase subunit delta [Campylobacter sp. US33a]
MECLVVKKYAKAIFLSKDADYICEQLNKISQAFSISRFKAILESYDIKKEKKIEFVMSILGEVKPSLHHLIQLLGLNSRLALIPNIVEELKKQKALEENIYFGTIYSKESLEENKINELEQGLSKRFDAKIKLNSKQTDQQGIKISLEELGYEISFSMDNLKTKLNEYILKII